MNPPAAPEANHLLQFWLILSLTFSTLVSAATFIVMLANRKQKREVNFAVELASKAEFDRHVEKNEREHENIFTKLGGMDRGQSSKLSVEITAVHNRVNGLEKSIGGLETSAELTNQRLAQIDTKVDRLIERKS